MVTSQEMTENEMGYRGSKSELLMNSVKEQRVDGSCFGISPKLRCTLMGREICYQTKNPSKQIVIPASFDGRAKNFILVLIHSVKTYFKVIILLFYLSRF